MTAPYERTLRPEARSNQWTDYGVTVGHDVYGSIHIHPPVPPGRPPRSRSESVSPMSAVRHEAVRAALTALVGACERAAAALSSAALWAPESNRPDGAGKEER